MKAATRVKTDLPGVVGCDASLYHLSPPMPDPWGKKAHEYGLVVFCGSCLSVLPANKNGAIVTFATDWYIPVEDADCEEAIFLAKGYKVHKHRVGV